MISKSETETVSRALQTALDAGAQKARITYSKSEEDLVAKTLERFQGLDQETARHDVKEFLNAISVAIEDDKAD